MCPVGAVSFKTPPYKRSLAMTKVVGFGILQLTLILRQIRNVILINDIIFKDDLLLEH